MRPIRFLALVVAFSSLAVPAARAQVDTCGTGAGDAHSFARHASCQQGWSSTEYRCLDVLWDRESSWKPTAGHVSGSYGIPQAYPGRKMAAVAADWRTNPRTQITWGVAYIAGRYRRPCAALALWNRRSPHWY